VEELRSILRKYWGYDEFRPLQQEAMRSVVQGRDSVVVLPTGGGKSLCFQAPALHLPGLAVVVSPLISLMKDQVDALTDSGVPAACVNSTLSPVERRQVADDVRSGRLKLLYLSPERLMTERTLEFLKDASVSFFAIDEAHCISDWGHDFRPEYRMLRALKQQFPGVAVHAYTATAGTTLSASCTSTSRMSWSDRLTVQISFIVFSGERT
jgi:ATP-dependent DNA helicase RecQ